MTAPSGDDAAAGTATAYRTDMLDYPTAFAIQRQQTLEHHPKCSQPSMLCDCGAVEGWWEAYRKAVAARQAECRAAVLPEGEAS